MGGREGLVVDSNRMGPFNRSGDSTDISTMCSLLRGTREKLPEERDNVTSRPNISDVFTLFTYRRIG
jgi:hypothetical protein